MSNPLTAAQDPIFWLHHANVDRLWKRWLRQGGGRANPDAKEYPEWTTQRFTFFDEDGNDQVMSVAEMLETTTIRALGYRYDDDPPAAGAGAGGGGARRDWAGTWARGGRRTDRAQ